MLNLSRRIGEIFESSEIGEKRALLNFLLQNLTVNGKTPAFSLRSPFDTILSFANQPTGLRWLDVFGTLNWRSIQSDLSFLAPSLASHIR